MPEPTPAARALNAITSGQARDDAAVEHRQRTGAHVEMVQKASRAQRSSAPAFEEIGTTGLRHYGGFVVEEWLARLSGRRGVLVWREMADNDPVIGAILFAIEMLARGVDWNVEPGADDKATELVETSKDDMSHTWPDFIAEVFSMLTYGWDLQEIVYKRRLGPDPQGTDPNGDPLPSSRYDDGLIGWRKLTTRAQETLQNWEFADDGGIQAMVQIAYDGAKRTIPLEKALLFRTTTKRNNPEGRSVLRNGFVSWFRKKNIEEIEAIGVERDLAGIPLVQGPEDIDLWSEANADKLRAAQDLATSVRRDEDEGIVLPHGWSFSLVSAAGSRQLDTDKIVRRYDQRIATTVLADFILLAQDQVGSFALGKVKVDTFGQAMQAWLTSVAEVLNRYAIPRLLKLNGLSVVDPPRFVPGDVGELDLEVIGQFLQSLSLAGAPIDWSQPLMAQLFELAGLPEPEEQTNEEAARGAKPGEGPYDAGLQEPPEGEAPPGEPTAPAAAGTVGGA